MRVKPAGLLQTTLRDQCGRVGISLRTYYQRRANGLTHDEAMSLPAQRGRQIRDRLALEVPERNAIKRWFSRPVMHIG